MSSAIINFFLYTIFSSVLLGHIFGFSTGVGQNYLNQKPKPKAVVLGITEKAEKNKKLNLNLLPKQTSSTNKNSTATPIIPPPILKAQAGLIKDLNSQRILFAKKASRPHSLASVSKLMTALIFLEHNPGWDKIYQIKQSDRRRGGRIYLYSGDKVAIKDLFYASLVGSANTATIALVSATGLSEEEFVQEMNKKALAWNLKKTIFYEPTGLDQRNISTPTEIAVLAQKALTKPPIAQATITKTYSFKTKQGRQVIIPSTDYLLDVFPSQGIKILGGKTGYNEKAGYCFVGLFNINQKQQLISIVMGANSKKMRFDETKKLVEWALKQSKILQ